MPYYSVMAEIEGKAKRVTRGDKEWLIAPVVMIVEGVLNDFLVSSDAIDACHWDGVPVVINHPMAGKDAVSANDPYVIEDMAIGRVFNTQITETVIKGQRLARASAELWLDPLKAEGMGGEAKLAIEMIEAGEQLEVSTGFFSVDTGQQGLFNGQRFIGTHQNLQADHLALLPTSTGACSWQDGCGCPRTHQHKGKTPMRLFKRKPPDVQQTNDDIREAIMAELAREQGSDFSDFFFVEVAADNGSFVYRRGDRLFERGLAVGAEGSVSLGEDEKEVQRVTEFRPVTNKGKTMPTTNEPIDPTLPVDPIAVVIPDPYADLSDEEMAMIEAGKAAKTELVEALSALEDGPFTRDELTLMNLRQLRGLMKISKPTDYSLQGLPAPVTHAAGDDEWERPTPPKTY